MGASIEIVYRYRNHVFFLRRRAAENLTNATLKKIGAKSPITPILTRPLCLYIIRLMTRVDLRDKMLREAGSKSRFYPLGQRLLAIIFLAFSREHTTFWFLVSSCCPLCLIYYSMYQCYCKSKFILYS